MTPEKLAAYREAIGGRRFIMTIGAGIFDTALVVGHFISEQTYLTLTLATVAVFIGAKTYEQVKELRSA
jgi:hypothetical protein